MTQIEQPPNRKPFNLHKGDKIKAEDKILGGTHTFEVTMVSKWVFLAVRRDIGVERSFFKDDYELGKIRRSE